MKKKTINTKVDTHFLSLIIPSYRQEKTIIKNVKAIREVLNEVRYDYEIIVVVDGMIDKTFQKLKKARLKKVHVIAYEKNQGKSYAIRLGMHFAKGDYVMFLDAGMEIDPNGISMLLEHMEWYKADIIVGSKRHPASKVKYSSTRLVLSYAYYYLVKALFRVKVRDTQAGIKIYRKRVLQKVLPRLVEKRFAGDLEFMVVSKQMGFKRIYEAPIKLNYGLAKMTSAATWKSIRGILIDTAAIFYRAYIIRYYIQKPNKYKTLQHMKLHQVKR